MSFYDSLHPGRKVLSGQQIFIADELVRLHMNKHNIRYSIRHRHSLTSRVLRSPLILLSLYKLNTHIQNNNNNNKSGSCFAH